jgi:hypothetical protein
LPALRVAVLVQQSRGRVVSFGAVVAKKLVTAGGWQSCVRASRPTRESAKYSTYVRLSRTSRTHSEGGGSRCIRHLRGTMNRMKRAEVEVKKAAALGPSCFCFCKLKVEATEARRNAALGKMKVEATAEATTTADAAAIAAAAAEAAAEEAAEVAEAAIESAAVAVAAAKFNPGYNLDDLPQGVLATIGAMLPPRAAARAKCTCRALRDACPRFAWAKDETSFGAARGFSILTSSSARPSGSQFARRRAAHPASFHIKECLWRRAVVSRRLDWTLCPGLL